MKTTELNQAKTNGKTKAQTSGHELKKPASLPRVERKEAAMALCRVLANTYVLYLKTQKCHWNVTGPLFHPSHVMFEHQYKEMFEAIDDIAERIRSLDHVAPGSFAEFSELADIRERTSMMDHHAMITDLIESHEILVQRLRESLEVVQSTEDVVTEDLLVHRLARHEKDLWMLKSQLI